MARPRSSRVSARLAAMLGTDAVGHLSQALDDEALKNVERELRELEQLGQLRGVRFALQLYGANQRHAEALLAQQLQLLDRKLDRILDGLTPPEAPPEIPPQWGVRMERYHKAVAKQIGDLAAVVEQLTKEVSAKALASDGYAVQACEVLGLVRRELHALAASQGVDLSPALGELAVGDGCRRRSRAA